MGPPCYALVGVFDGKGSKEEGYLRQLGGIQGSLGGMLGSAKWL